MSSEPDIRATITRALAVTVPDPSVGPWPSVSESAPMPQIGDVLGMHYRLERLLGEGTFGTVYVAQRVDVPEHRVALKLLRRSHYEGRNVERELVMLATVGHPHVVQLKDHGTTEHFVWFTMPMYEGETLADRLVRGPLELEEAYEVFSAAARGVEALHAAGLRHQDIKPENIFLARFGSTTHPVVLDLGAAAEVEAKFVAGTALFASPEQLQAFAGKPLAALELTEKMDTYCLASTLLVALVGPDKFPGNGASNRLALGAAQRERCERPLHPTALLELSAAAREGIESAFIKWLAEAPSDRPSAKQFAEQLDVLREPSREAERLEQALRQRQRSTLRRSNGSLALSSRWC